MGSGLETGNKLLTSSRDFLSVWDSKTRNDGGTGDQGKDDGAELHIEKCFV